MRTDLALMLVASCTAPARYTAIRTTFGNAPVSLLADAVETARAQHYDVAAVDSERGQFVALPTSDATPGVRTAMVVHLEARGWMCKRGRRCFGGSRTVVAVTPIVLRDGHELPPDEVPELAIHRADDLSWAILASVRH